MDDRKFTIDDAAGFFGGDEAEEEIDLDPEIEPEPEPGPDPEVEFRMKLLDSRADENPETDNMIVDIREKALEMVEKCGSIYKLTLQGRLEIEFPLTDKRMIRKAIDSLKEHSKVKWPHGMLLQKV